MKTGNKKGMSQLWKRNAVVAVIAVFVCAAVYLNWSYEQEAGKTLGESTMVPARIAPIRPSRTTLPSRETRAAPTASRPVQRAAMTTLPMPGSTASSLGTAP